MKTQINNLAMLNGCHIQLRRTKGELARDGDAMFFLSNSERWAGARMPNMPPGFYYSWYLFRIQEPELCLERDAFTADVLDLCGRK
jgi:hypothetical protein